MRKVPCSGAKKQPSSNAWLFIRQRGKTHIVGRNSDSVLRRMIEPRIRRNTAIAYCALRLLPQQGSDSAIA
jgi:hypothetical protein